MAKEKKENLKLKIAVHYNELGRLTMIIGKQAEICNKEREKLQKLQAKANELATEIEKLDG